MPTTVIRYVDAASTGGDGTTRALSGANAAYSGIRAGLAAEYAATPNLVTSDILLKMQCVGSSADTSTTVLTGTAPFVTDATRYLIVETPVGDRPANPYVWSTSHYRWSVSINGNFWAMRNNKVILRGLQIENLRNGTAAGWIQVSPNAAGHDLLVEQCHYRTPAVANTGRAFSLDGAVAGVVIIRNCIINMGASTAAVGGLRSTSTAAGTTLYFDNNTVSGCSGTAFLGSASHTTICRNNIGHVNGVDFGANLTQSYNASSDATATGTGSRASQTFTFTGAGDYSLSGSDAGARTFGTNLSADPNDPFATDFAENARGTTWDIGASQVTADGGSSGRPPYEGLTRGIARGLRAA